MSGLSKINCILWLCGIIIDFLNLSWFFFRYHANEDIKGHGFALSFKSGAHSLPCNKPLILVFWQNSDTFMTVFRHIFITDSLLTDFWQISDSFWNFLDLHRYWVPLFWLYELNVLFSFEPARAVCLWLCVAGHEGNTNRKQFTHPKVEFCYILLISVCLTWLPAISNSGLELPVWQQFLVVPGFRVK